MKNLSIDRWLVAMVLNLRWRKNPKIVAERIRSFQTTEADSAWQLLYATESIQEPAMKAKLFEQALEETHHAEIFAQIYKDTFNKPMPQFEVERKSIHQRHQDWKLLAYCAVGEAAAAKRFSHIAEALPDIPLKSALEKILEEEAGHVELAHSLARKIGQSEQSLKKEIRRIKRQRAWEAWLRAGRNVTQAISKGLLYVSFFAIGGFIKGEKK